MKRRTTARHIATVGAVAIAGVACGVPAGPDSFEPIPDDVVPGDLSSPSTTTTTTTLPSTTTTIALDPPEVTSTTMAIVPTQIVQVFFVSRGRLTGVETAAPVAPEPFDLILLLERGPEGPLAGLLDNLVQEGLIVETSRSGGVITVELDERLFERVADRDEAEVIGQIVLTFLDTLSGVGQVAFTVDGDPLTVPTGGGLFTDQPVSRDDYASLLADSSGDESVSGTTTIVTPTTTPLAGQ